ncbi:MAG: hypothetical protein LM564_04635 [Desulfurococcaceae archaeon]|nr:hypothetical protein [Desulfurococcaceae archaeon]
MSSLQEDIRNMLMSLYNMSPAYNSVVQALFILPEKVRVLMGMYPELMEREDELMELLSLRYTERGFIEVYGDGLGHQLVNLYRRLFTILADTNKRSLLLKLAGFGEEEFRKYDPLRAWIEVSLEFLAKVRKDALRLLDIVIAKLSGKKPDEYVGWDEIKTAATDIKDFDALRSILRRFFLLPYSSEYAVYRRDCPLLLDAYSDLRAKLSELLR